MEIENGNWEGLQEGGGECDVMYDVLFVVEVVRIEASQAGGSEFSRMQVRRQQGKEAVACSVACPH